MAAGIVNKHWMSSEPTVLLSTRSVVTNSKAVIPPSLKPPLLKKNTMLSQFLELNKIISWGGS